MTGEMQRYIGDGVYASFDGYQIWVRAERDGMIHSIALEVGVLNMLIDYANTVYVRLEPKGTNETGTAG